MLRLIEDDPEAQRLLLRAPPWSLVEVLRRGLASVLLLAVAATALMLADLVPIGAMLFGVSPCLLLLACCIYWMHAEQVSELRVDGANHCVHVRLRGRRLWWSATQEVRLDDEHALIRLCCGAVPNHGFHRPEIGMEMYVGRFGERMRLLAPVFSIEQIDRRDEVEALAQAIARRLDVGLTVEKDDALTYAVQISRRAQPPPALPEQARGYRLAPRAPGLARDRAPSFEAPRDPPPPVDGALQNFREQIVRADDGKLEMIGARRATPGAWWKQALRVLGLCALILAVPGAAISWAVEGDPLSGLLFGLYVTPIAVAMLAALLVAARVLAATLAVLADLSLVVLSSASHRNPGLLDRLSLRSWKLGTGALSGRALIPLHWRRGEVSAVVVIERSRTSGGRGNRKMWTWYELYLRSKLWVRLARTHERVEKPTDTVPAEIVALAIEVARELDVPVRRAG